VAEGDAVLCDCDIYTLALAPASLLIDLSCSATTAFSSVTLQLPAFIETHINLGPLGHHRQAVKLLEEGCSVFWVQALQLHKPMMDLCDMAPEPVFSSPYISRLTFPDLSVTYTFASFVVDLFFTHFPFQTSFTALIIFQQ
jgi:hypothetical protein